MVLLFFMKIFVVTISVDVTRIELTWNIIFCQKLKIKQQKYYFLFGINAVKQIYIRDVIMLIVTIFIIYCWRSYLRKLYIRSRVFFVIFLIKMSSLFSTSNF